MGLIKEFTADKLKVQVYSSRNAMGEKAAEAAGKKIMAMLSVKPEINIIFAAAPSQNEFFSALAAYQGIEWERINAFHMDEYIGLDKSAPQGFGNFLKEKLFSKVPFKSIYYIDGDGENPEQECARYSELLTLMPPDIVCMGIGENGHIAFNDPHVANFKDDKLVKVVELDKKCRQQQVNDGCFEFIDQVPTHAITLTIPALIKGNQIFCMVPALTKAEAVYNTVKGLITENCPASILREHENAILYTDKDSASRIL